jgi:ergothioneine biosynthesis protein EgtB
MSSVPASPALHVLRADPSFARGTPAASEPDAGRAFWRGFFRAVRDATERRTADLSPEDQMVQSMPDASPTKWHRAHTTWFFEQFLLQPHLADYRVFDREFGFLFNSYYVAAGPRHARPKRGLLTRPDCARITSYRRHVDAAVERLIAEAALLPEVVRILEIGLNHEQQHQELIVTDILHAFAHNPLAPACQASWAPPVVSASRGFAEIPAGLYDLGFAGAGYSFDNESPAHQVQLGRVRIARALVSNAQWLDFMADGGYANPALWLSDGWAMREQEGWRAPGYWREQNGSWQDFTPAGLRPVDPAAPVCHVSYYEADAFARWSGCHLPSEAEWEVASRLGLIEDAFGLVWQWTRSAYAPYPGYRPAAGALGEYNGKFMVNQMVLRGSSHATPAGHSRVTYRNFFYPPARWQFSGLRLATYDR